MFQEASPAADPHHSHHSLIPATPPVYAPGIFRRQSDQQLAEVSSFLARHPEYQKLPVDALAQYAATYRDDRDHAMEQDFRDESVLCGCRADYARPESGKADWDAGPACSDDCSFNGEVER
jgi:hypothetical protein